MSDPILGQIAIFAGNFAPRGWALCHGQILSIASNTALFSLLGTQYGGNGSTTFALPDLRGRAPIGGGTGPGLSPRRIGERGGSQTHTLNIQEMPAHTHQITGAGGGGKLSTEKAVRETPVAGDVPAVTITKSGLADVELKSFGPENANSVNAGSSSGGGATIALSGASQPHNIMQPYVTLNYCIATTGVYPSRS